MAEALHQLTGFPVRCIDFAGGTHAFVLSPDEEVLDIHGKMAWPKFLEFLVAEQLLPRDAVTAGRVIHRDVSELAQSILWRHAGYKPPSQTAIRQAIAAARNHPNLRGFLPEKPKSKSAS